MGVMIEREEGDLRVLRITGLLRKSQWDAVLATEARQWGPTTHVKVLVMMEDFKGWERGVDWGDITFFDTYGDQIDKIAIVADAKWEVEIVAFAGAGFPACSNQILPLSQLTLARSWLG